MIVTWQSNPASIVVANSPAAWFRFGQGITLGTGSGGLGVLQWNDQSGNGNHLKQSSATLQPVVQSDGSILFDGIQQFLRTSTFTLAQPYTFYLLMKQVTWILNGAFCDGDAIGNCNIFDSVGTPTIAMFSGSTVASNNGLAVNTYAVVSGVFNGASSSLQVNNNTATTGNPGARAANGVTLGATGAAAAQWSNIQVKEAILVPSSPSSTVRAGIVNYLAKVGGLGI